MKGYKGMGRDFSYLEKQLQALSHEASEYRRKKDFQNALKSLEMLFKLTQDANFDLLLSDNIRHANYLQAAGFGDKGWSVLNKLILEHPFDSAALEDIHNAMRLFLQREKRSSLAISHGLLSHLYKIKKYVDWNEKEINNYEIDLKKYENYQIPEFVERFVSNHENTIRFNNKWIQDLISEAETTHLILGLLKKAKLENKLIEVQKIFQDHLLRLPKIDGALLAKEINALF
ncbi:MAG: hypothetical protein U0003_01675 [Vampirovibrionales bacterium]